SLYFSLDEALREAPEGASVQLEPGRHRVRGPLSLRKTVDVTGADAETTTLSVNATKYAIGVSTEGRVTISNLTLEPDSWLPCDVVRVVRGQFEAWECRFRNGRAEPNDTTTGCGLVLANDAHGVLTRCLFVQNQRHGLVLRDRAKFRIEKCK